MNRTHYLFVCIIVFLLLNMCKTLLCVQTTIPMFYQVPFIHRPYSSDTTKWAINLAVTLQQSYAHRAFNEKQNKKALFDFVGTTQLTRLGLNLENITQTDQPTTYYYWFNNGPFSDPSKLSLKDDDGHLSIGAAFHSTQATIVLKQNLPWNLYFLASMPIRQVKANKIAYQLEGAKVITSGNVSVNMQTFVDKDLPLILEENNLSPLTEKYEQTDLSDTQCSIGWFGKTNNNNSLIKTIQGSVQANFLLPFSTEQGTNSPLPIPTGHNKHIGFGVNIELETVLRDVLTIGLLASATAFLKKDQPFRLKTDKKQQGLIILEKSFVNFDPGSIWNVGGYIAFDQFVKNLSIKVGYMFTQQEHSRVEVEDSNYLKTLKENADGSKAKPFVSQNDYANSDNRFVGWTTQTVHAAVSYQLPPFSFQKMQPLLALEYIYPIAGKHSFCTETFGGTLGLRFEVSF